MTNFGAVAVATLHYAFAQNETLLLCAKAKRQRMFYLCESVATATTKRPVGT
ncbi:hypothetical protein [Lysinibacillus xylanilyticus]|uniref:hypothetical protein n=1 Tax=Lysinibacillus xylanilyticus TaxID=582475 RepID=UPI00137924C2|nr:hypothetical protein [Lysinibacillus xylanilyticus]